MNSRVHGRAIKQQRGRQTYDALVDAGFRLLETKDLDKISIAELSTEAGYSIGAFYARFNSKDEFFDALVAAHKSQRAETLKQMYEKLPVEKLVPQLVKNIIEYYQKNRHFWRASQMRNVRDPVFAQAFRDNFMYRCEIFIAHMERQLHRKLSKSEGAAIVFAFQLLMSTVNNAAFNEPGPIVLGQKRYVHEMQRAFILVSGLEQLFAEIAARNVQ
jgi:AcrR family transcriptional regulator